jgi:hypothetical protein
MISTQGLPTRQEMRLNLTLFGIVYTKIDIWEDM